MESWFSLVAPAATPMAVVRRINGDLVNTMAVKEISDAIEKLGIEVFPTTPEQHGAMIKADWPKWSAAVKASGAKAQ